jgi:uncharacterized protein
LPFAAWIVEAESGNFAMNLSGLERNPRRDIRRSHNILERELQKPFILNIPIVVFERTMKRSEILQKLAAHRDELTQMGVKTLAVFGSVARDEARPDSDVDIMVEFQGPATFNGYMDLKFFLEDLLGYPVDLVTRKSIRSRLKTQIENEALYVQGLPAVS